MICVELSRAEVWADGVWLGEHDPADVLRETLAAPRIARSDRLTRIAAGVTARATRELEAIEGDRVAILGGTVLASIRTNEAYESRRLRTGRAPPRDFPYTAPNAWLGEIGGALGARGPSLCLVGDGAVGVAALATATRWLDAGECDRAMVLVAECAPETDSLVPTSFYGYREGAAVLVVHRARESSRVLVEVELATVPVDATLMSSVNVFERIALAALGDGENTLEVPSRVGMGWRVRVRGSSDPYSR